MRLSEQDVHNIVDNPWKVRDFMNAVARFLTESVTLSISPTTIAYTEAQAGAGKTIPVTLTLLAGGVIVPFADFAFTAEIADTSSGNTATLDDTTPTFVDGKVVVNVGLPAGTYVGGETATLTIPNITLPDGRTVTGGTCVVTITDTVAPTLSTAVVEDADKDALVLTFSEAMKTTPLPAATAFTIAGADAGGRTVTTVAASGSTVTLTLSSALAAGNVITVAYTKPASNPLKDANGVDCASFTAHAVTNNVA